MITVMSTLEERVLEAIEATGLKVPVLADKIGVSLQTIYDWKKGKSLGEMKSDNLVELAHLAGYEPRWIRKEKGLKKKAITREQEIILELAELMQQEARKNWIENGKFLTSVNPTDKGVDASQAQPIKLTPAGARIGGDKDRPKIYAPGRIERRKQEVQVTHDRRKERWTYEKKGED
jgi:hypothetical protein